MMFFGMAASKMGVLGASIGWASFQTIAIVTVNVVGFLSGEWKNASKKLFLLLAGVAVIAF